MQTIELEQQVDAWLREHAPEHRGHHVQVGGGGVICHTCPGVPEIGYGAPSIELGMLAVA